MARKKIQARDLRIPVTLLTMLSGRCKVVHGVSTVCLHVENDREDTRAGCVVKSDRASAGWIEDSGPVYEGDTKKLYGMVVDDNDVPAWLRDQLRPEPTERMWYSSLYGKLFSSEEELRQYKCSVLGMNEAIIDLDSSSDGLAMNGPCSVCIHRGGSVSIGDRKFLASTGDLTIEASVSGNGSDLVKCLSGISQYGRMCIRVLGKGEGNSTLRFEASLWPLLVWVEYDGSVVSVRC